MTTIQEAKAMARRLRNALAKQDVAISHGAALEVVAAELGHDSWNIACTKLGEDTPAAGTHFVRTIPILRSFDEAKAREFYCGFLGFSVDFEHRFEPGLPLYLQISRAGLVLHLSEHHGDASPGSTVYVETRGLRELHRELSERQYAYGRPGIERQEWGDELTVHDPFGNRIRFCEPSND